MADTPLPAQPTPEVNGSVRRDSSAGEDRINKAEENPKEKSGSGTWPWISDVLKTLLPSIVLAVLGWALKDTVDLALREREIQLEAVKEMETLIPDLQKKDLSPEDAQAKAAQLAAFGQYSVSFFVNILEVGSQNAKAGAEEGLRMVARSDPQSVCAPLQTAITNHSALYVWQTHLTALRVLGQAGCTKACKDVASYRDNMGTLDEYKNWVSSRPEQSEMDKVHKQASDTFDQLKHIHPADCQ